MILILFFVIIFFIAYMKATFEALYVIFMLIKEMIADKKKKIKN